MDDELVTAWAIAAQRGDREAAAAFIRATAPSVRRLMGYLADREDAEDLVQETYLRAFGALPRYAGRSPARVWLLSIARRVAADQVRYNQRRPRSVSLDIDLLDIRHHVPAPAGLVEVNRAIAALEPGRREAFLLTRVVGLSYEEAAQVCGCPVGTIRSRVSRARQDLLDALGPDDRLAAGLG